MPKAVIKSSHLIKKIYFVGIKGVGMTSLAILAKEAGFTVSGSDIEEEFLTDEILSKNHIQIDSGFNEDAIERFKGSSSSDEILLIATAAHDGLENKQSEYAKKNGIQVATHGQAVGFFMEGELFKRSFLGVSVLGCHGKTTVSAMCATALSFAGLNPSYVVGTSEIFPLGNPGHFGKGEYFVAEADEFISDVNHDRTVKFLYQYPQYTIINNIDFDHPDVYKDIHDVYEAFLKFGKENILENGTLIINGDELLTQKLIKELKAERTDITIITFGEGIGNDIRIKNYCENEWGSKFEVLVEGKEVISCKIRVPGFHNAKNSLAAFSLLKVLGIATQSIPSMITEFTGSKRRQEKLGETVHGAVVVDDYAHHPDEIEKTVLAIQNSYKQKKIIVLFQPHTVGRTVSLVDLFAKAFRNVSEVLFLPVFSSKREQDMDYSHVYAKIEDQMRQNGTGVVFFKDERDASELNFSPYFLKKYRSNVVKYILEKYDSSEFVIVALGAGDVYKIAYDLAVLSK